MTAEYHYRARSVTWDVDMFKPQVRFGVCLATEGSFRTGEARFNTLWRVLLARKSTLLGRC